MIYIYESHLGGLYVTDEQRSYEDLYCEQCNDADWPGIESDNLQDIRAYLDSQSDSYSEEELSSIFEQCKAMLEAEQ